MKNEKNTHWYKKKIFVDLETGEVISEENFKKNYYLVKKSKKYAINKQTSTGTTISINECRRTGTREIFE